MREAFLDAGTLRGYGGQLEDLDAGLSAVLAIVGRDQAPTQDAYDAAVRALEKHRARADRAEAELADFREKVAALAAIEDYIGESGENAARNMRDLLVGVGDNGNDPRVQARAWDLVWINTAPNPSEVDRG